MTPSRIHRLTLTHFRNYRAASLDTRGDMVVLVGPNGAGKTNCLEAISFLSPGRGLRRARLEDAADNQGDGSWAISAEVEGAYGLATLGTGIDAPRADGTSSTRRVRIDREPVTSAAAFGDHFETRVGRERVCTRDRRAPGCVGSVRERKREAEQLRDKKEKRALRDTLHAEVSWVRCSNFESSVSRDSTCSGSAMMHSTGHTSTHCGVS